MRAFLLLLHRYCGLISVAFLAVAALTGCLLVVREPLDRALNPDLFVVGSERPATIAETVAAIDALRTTHPEWQVTGFPLRAQSGQSTKVNIDAKPGSPAPEFDEVFLDPSEEVILGGRRMESALDARHFVMAITELHFNLMGGTPGRLFLGFVAVLWLLSIVAGLVLTTPEKGPFWRRWWRTWQMRRSSSLPRQLLDLHRASGLWFLPFLALLAATSIAFNFWSEAYAPAVTAISPLEHDLFDEAPPHPEGAVPRLGYADILPLAEQRARKTGLAWEPATMIYLSEWNLYGVKFSPGGMLSYEALGPVDHYFDGDTGAWAHEVDPYSDSMGLVMIRIVYPLHSGEIFGTVTLVLVFVLGLVTLGQSLTGLYVWWKKRRSRLAQRKAARRRVENTA